MAIFNAVMPVVALVEARNSDEAFTRMRRALDAAGARYGFDPYCENALDIRIFASEPLPKGTRVIGSSGVKHIDYAWLDDEPAEEDDT